MDIIIDQQISLDEALVPHASGLRMGKSNFRLRSDIKSKESTLQVVYDVLKLTPFYKVFLVTAYVPEIYMQEFWTTTTVHHHSICFKMNNKKRIVNLEYFKEMLQICPRIPNRQFDELPFEKEILHFFKNLVIVEHKDTKKSNEMYYPRFKKVIVNFFMTKDQSIPRTNKYSAILPVELTNEAIRNSESYKEYYVIASGAEPPKTKASVRKKQSSSKTTMPPPTATGKRLKTSAKLVSRVLSLWSNPNKELKLGRSCIDELRTFTGEGAGVCCTCEMIGMDGRGRVVADNKGSSAVVMTGTSTLEVDSK
nr:hypothetical protein [Tanacetum cinerariifolium]